MYVDNPFLNEIDNIFFLGKYSKKSRLSTSDDDYGEENRRLLGLSKQERQPIGNSENGNNKTLVQIV